MTNNISTKSQKQERTLKQTVTINKPHKHNQKLIIVEGTVKELGKKKGRNDIGNQYVILFKPPPLPPKSGIFPTLALGLSKRVNYKSQECRKSV